MAKKKLLGIVCPSWMLTFGDCMSLLLTFFVMLMTFSTMNESKLMDAAGSIQGAMGLRDPKEGLKRELSLYPETKEPVPDGKLFTEIKDPNTKTEDAKASSVRLRTKTILQRFNKLERQITQYGFKNAVSVHQLDQGIQVNVDESLLFQGATDKLSNEVRVLLQGFVNLAYDVNNEIRITAEYQDGMKVGQDYFFSPSYLAVKRAEAVGDYFASEFKLKSSRLGFAVAQVPSGEPCRVQLMVVEKIGYSEVKLEELLDFNQR